MHLLYHLWQTKGTSFYVASIILTIVTRFLFFVFDTAGNAIIAFGEEFFARNKPEDAHFTTYLPMTDEEIEELEENPYGSETVLVAAEETKDGKGVSVISSKQLEAEMI